jgi:CBS-domain-containing membrane protein
MTNATPKKDYGKIFFQCGLVCIMIFILLFSIAMSTNLGVLSVVGASSLVASTVIVLIFPSSIIASSRDILLGYLLATIMGIICFSLANEVGNYFHVLFRGEFRIVFAVLAVGVTIFVMIMLRIVHPPALGFAVGLVLDPWNFSILFILITYTLLLCLVKRLLHHQIYDLL